MSRIKNVIKKGNMKYFIVGIVIILLFLLLFSHFKISKLEELTIKKYSNQMMVYMDYLEKDEIDYYVCYTLTYYENEYNQKEVNIKDIVNFINTHFKKQITKKQVETLGITPFMIDKHITYNSDKNSYIINANELSYSDIAKIKLVKYDIEKIKKKSNNTYEVTYNTYEIENPYELLNYYVDKNNKKTAEKINLYLTGKISKKNIIKYITNKNIDKIGKKKDIIKIYYVIRDDDILIDKK